MVHVIGGGLAGSEASWQAAEQGVPVVLHEMRPVRPTEVHKTDRLAELVCSNSFRGDKLDNAVGLLKEEMRRLGSLVMRAADAHRVPAGAAHTLQVGGVCCLAAAAWFARTLPALRAVVRPIYVRLGILPEVAAGLNTAAEVSVPPERG